MQNFDVLRLSRLMKITNTAGSKFVRALVKSLSLPLNQSMRGTLKLGKRRTANQAIANDWKKIGVDMKSGVLKYDQQITARRATKSER